MQDVVERAIEEYHIDGQDGTVVSAYVHDDGEMTHYFTLITTRSIPEFEHEPTSSTKIECTHVPIDQSPFLVPNEREVESAGRELSVELTNGSTWEHSFRSDVRMLRRTSAEMSAWGSEFPALCFEHWAEGQYVPDASPSDKEAIAASLLDRSGIELEKYPDYAGNVLVVLEDRRVGFRYGESSEELIERMQGDEEVDEDDLLRFHDKWIVEVHENIRTEGLDITMHRTEFDALLRSEVVPLTDANAVSREQAVTDAREANWPEDQIYEWVALIQGDETQRYRLPDTYASSASDQTLRVSKDGIVLDEVSCPLMRQMNLQLDVRSPGQSTPDYETPPQLLRHEGGHRFVTGRRIWDDRLTDFGPVQEIRAWTTRGGYNEALSDIISDLLNAVKIIDPYFGPDQLTDIVTQFPRDIPVWIITALPDEEYDESVFLTALSRLHRRGHTVRIKRIVDKEGRPTETPLHDRFILTQGNGWLVGCSFSTIESNFSVISELLTNAGEEVDRIFDRWWRNPVLQKDNRTECEKHWVGKTDDFDQDTETVSGISSFFE